MIIAIATNDRKTIAKRTGRAGEFAFFEVDGNQILKTTYQKNNHEHHDHDRSEGNHRQGRGQGQGLGRGHGHGLGHGRHHHHEEHSHEEEHSHDEVIEQLKDVDIFLVRAVGKYLKSDLERGKIPYKLVRGEALTDIVNEYINNVSKE